MSAQPLRAEAKHAFLSSVAAATGCKQLTALRELLPSVAPAATSWGIEIDPEYPTALPAFGCAIPTSVNEWPAAFASAPALLSLRALLRRDQVHDHWFLELDASEAKFSYSQSPHCFARLSFAARNTETTAALLRESASLLGLGALPAAAVSAAVAAMGCITDLGIVERAGVQQARAGVEVDGSVCAQQLAPLGREAWFAPAVCALVASCPVALRSTAQLSIRCAQPQLQLVGVELSTAEDDWPALLQHLHSQGVLDGAAASSARAWAGRVVLPRVGAAWPGTLARAISHIKLVPRAGALATKIYLSAAERFSLFA